MWSLECLLRSGGMGSEYILRNSNKCMAPEMELFTRACRTQHFAARLGNTRPSLGAANEIVILGTFFDNLATNGQKTAKNGPKCSKMGQDKSSFFEKTSSDLALILRNFALWVNENDEI